MSKLPTVAIIGRPNTGKSTLFNRLVGRRKAIVSETPGTTRDHVAERIASEEVDYLLIDTGGMGGGTDDKDFESDVHAQSLLALEHADLILFMIDGRTELTSSDYEILENLRKKRRKHVPVILVISKMDNPKVIDQTLPRFYELGFGDSVMAISAAHNVGMEELQTAVEQMLKKLHFGKFEDEVNEDRPRIAIIGKPNVGKSSIINAFMSESQRKESPLLVSEIAGTTRDATDTEIKYHGKSFVLTDTAGLKKNDTNIDDIERFATLRTIQSLEHSDIAVIVLDAGQPVSRQDKRIASLAIDAGKGLIFLLNKVDMLKEEERKKIYEEFEEAFPFCRFAPIIACSAVTREGLLHLFDTIREVSENRVRRIPTSELNSWFQTATYGTPFRNNSKANYITQAEVSPPTFVVFVKDPKMVPASDLRFLDNRLRETFDFEGTPVRFITKAKGKE